MLVFATRVPERSNVTVYKALVDRLSGNPIRWAFEDSVMVRKVSFQLLCDLHKRKNGAIRC